MYIARQLADDARLTLSTYGHVLDELDDSPQIPAEDAIRAARTGHVSPVCHDRKAMRNAYVPVRREAPVVAGVRPMELGGLEPPTSWVRSRRSPN